MLSFYLGDEINITVWSLSETFIIIFAGCLPTLIPLWDNVIAKGRILLFITRIQDLHPFTTGTCITGVVPITFFHSGKSLESLH
jgi:hypothetical protein